MGVSSLLPLLEPSTRSCHVSEFRGHTVAVDTYCWLHRGALTCAMQLGKNEETDLYVKFCMKLIKMLLSYEIKPIMVFDGQRLPAKCGVEDKRRESRKQSRKQAIELLRLGKSDEAYKYFQRSIDISPKMALALIKECRKLKIDCIVAPYEADAQLAFFSLKGIAECIITEDSDLLLFGCKKVLYKMDVNGSGKLVDADKIHLAMKMLPSKFTFEKFRHMCILAGCDYLESLPGIGIKKALSFVKMTAETNPLIFLDRIARYTKVAKAIVDDNYKENFMIADATIKHQIVFDPFIKKMVPLMPVQGNPKYCSKAGKILDSPIALQLALGNLNPSTLGQMDDWQPDNNVHGNSIWSPGYKISVARGLVKPSVAAETKICASISKAATMAKNALNDEIFEKELEFYKKKPEVPVAAAAAVSNGSQSTDPETSPVLSYFSRNPFLKKKISKFDITKGETDQKVVSRFFSPGTPDDSQGKSSNDKINASDQENSQEKSNHDDEIDDTATVLEESVPLTPPYLGETLPPVTAYRYDVKISPISRKIKSVTMLPPSDESENRPIITDDIAPNENIFEECEEVNVPLVECECIPIVDDDHEIDFSTGVPVLVSSHQPNDKKRKALALKQTSIQHFFKRIRTD